LKKIIVIAPYTYLPYQSGGQKLIAQFTEELGQQAELFVVGTINNDASQVNNYELIKWLKPSFFRYLDISLIAKIRGLISIKQSELIIWEHPYFAWLAWFIKKTTGIKTIIHTHNIEFDRFRSTKRWWWPILMVYEKWCFSLADKISFITVEDKSFAQEKWNLPESKCLIMPYGIPFSSMPTNRNEAREKVKSMHTIPQSEQIFLFNGALDYAPNLEALSIIINEINPRLKKTDCRYKIIICGKGLPDAFKEQENFKDKNIIYAGFVPEINIYSMAADVLLNTVQTGGGIKTKLVEAIGFGTNVVSTKSGAQGVSPDLCNGKLSVVSDNDWNQFTEEILKLSTINLDTPATFYSTFYWGSIVNKLIEASSN
jgi:glycosyltransferase involved in cell wall biosynthesis